MNNKKTMFVTEPDTGTLSDDSTKKYFSLIGIGLFCAVVAQNLLSLASSYGIIPLLAKYLPELWASPLFKSLYSNIFSLFTIYCVAMPVFLLATRYLPRIKPEKKRMKPSHFIGGFCICWLGMGIGSYISNIVIILFEQTLKITTTNPVQESIDADSLWITLLFVCILAPIFEELFFRKVLCDRLLPLGEGYAVFISAAAFGLMHQNFYQFAYAFLIGVVFGFIYVKTGKIAYTIIYHSMANVIGSVIAPWVLSLVDMEQLLEITEAGPDALAGYDPAMLWDILKGCLAVITYSSLSSITSIVGAILFLMASRKKKFTFEKGILPPPSNHRISNIFCNVGVAAAITVFAISFVLSLLV